MLPTQACGSLQENLRAVRAANGNQLPNLAHPPQERRRAAHECPSCPRFASVIDYPFHPALHLLTPAEQALCSQLRILPKPYLVIKETLVCEHARRGWQAPPTVKVDANKTSRVWDFLVQAGYLEITAPSTAPADPA